MGNASVSRLLGHLDALLAGRAAGKLPDSQLLERFQSGHDEAAFAGLMQRHGPLVLGVCRRVLHNEHDAEDAFQATFLVLASQAASIRKQESVSSWLHSVAYRVAAKAKRDAARRHAVELRLADRVQADVLAQISGRELLVLLDEALQRLPERYRAPLVLCYLERKTQDEAARQLGWPRGTLKSRLERGRQLLHRRLTQRGVTLSALLVTTGLSQQAWAVVPAALQTATARGVLQFATNQAAGALSSRATALAKGVLQAMLLAKLRVAVLLLALSCVMAGAGLCARQVLLAEKPPAGKQEGGTKSSPGSTDQSKPPEEKPARTDRYGDPLPPGALARLGTVRLRQRQPALGVAFSPDSKILASAGWDEAIRLWDSETGKPLSQLTNRNREGTFAVAFSPDGSKLASVGSNGSVRLWEIATGNPLWEKKAHQGRVYGVAFAPDGRTLASAGDDRLVHVWDAATGNEVAAFEAGASGGDDSHAIAYSPDGKILASGFREQIRFWNLDTKAPLRTIDRAHGQSVTSLAFAAGGRLLVSGGARYVDATKEAGRPAVRPVPEVFVWDAATGKRLRDLKSNGPVGCCSIAISRDGKTLAVAHRDRIRLWDFAAGKPIREILSYASTSGPRAHDLAFSPDGKRLAAVAGDHIIRLWDVVTGKQLLGNPESHGWRVEFVAHPPGGRLVTSGTGDGTVRLWDSVTTRELHRLSVGPGVSDWVRATAVSPDGRVIAAAGTASFQYDIVSLLKLWSTDGGKELQAQRLAGIPTALAFAPDGKTLALASGRREGKREISLGDNVVALIDCATGKERARLTGPAQQIYALAFSPDGKTLFSVSEDQTVRLWNPSAKTERSRFTLTGQPKLQSAAFSADGRLLATGELFSDTVYVHELPTGRKLRRFQVAKSWSNALAFSPDSRILATSENYVTGARETNDYQIHLWEMASGREVHTFRSENLAVCSLVFSCDGGTLTSGMDDGTALVWGLPGLAAGGEQIGKREAIWDALAGEDAAKAYQVAWGLAATPERGMPLLREQLRPARPIDAQRLARLIADLDGADFKARQQATTELERLGEPALPALRRLLEGKPSLEARRRAENVVTRITGPITSGERLRIIRAMAVLEQIGTQTARQVLQGLAEGAPEALATQEAKAALARLAKRADASW